MPSPGGLGDYSRKSLDIVAVARYDGAMININTVIAEAAANGQMVAFFALVIFGACVRSAWKATK